MIDLDKLSALEKAAKPAPWYAWLKPTIRNIENKCITTIPEEQYIREYNEGEEFHKENTSTDEWRYRSLSCDEEVIGSSEWMRAEDEDFLLIVEMRNQLPELITQFEKMREELRMYRIFPGPMNRHYYGIDPFAPRHIVSLQLGTFYIKLLLDTLESNTPEWQWPELKRHLHYILTDYMIERENAMVDLSMEEKDDRRS